METREKNLLGLLRELSLRLSFARKWQLLLLAPLILISAVLEFFAVGSLYPFLSLLSNSEFVFFSQNIQSTVTHLSNEANIEPIMLLLLIFSAATVFSAAMKAFLIFYQNRLAAAIGTDLGTGVFEASLNQPYQLLITRNSSEIIAGAQKAKDMVSGFLYPLVVICSSGVIAISILMALVMVDPYVAIITFVTLSILYLFITFFTKNIINRNSNLIAMFQTEVTKTIQEGMGGIRDIILDGSQQHFVGKFKTVFVPLQRAIAINQIAGQIPRFFIEAAAILILALWTIYIAGNGGDKDSLAQLIPLLGTLAMGAQRLLPVAQQIYSAFITILASQASNRDAFLLMAPASTSAPRETTIHSLPFESLIELRNVSFRYNERSPWILKNLNWSIPKGSCIGVFGPSGQGKSTLLDLLLGLLAPTHGRLQVDGKVLSHPTTTRWQSRIAHVPQSIYILDRCVAENVAMGVPSILIDMDRVKWAVEAAQLTEVIQSLPDGYQTRVGERGVNLSGGERQRLGIARALYKTADVLILDEATSALDKDTEAKLLKSLMSKSSQRTIVLVTHHLATLGDCDMILELSNGALHHREVSHLVARNADE
jgi:ATP-binding cassette, subfamily B, bacterial PglK